MVHLFIFFIPICHDLFWLKRYSQEEDPWLPSFIVPLLEIVKLFSQKSERGKRNESRGTDSMFFTDLMTQYLAPTLTECSFIFQLQLQSSLLAVSVPLLLRLRASIPNGSFSMKCHFPFSRLQLFTTLGCYFTPPSLHLSVSHALRFFLFWFFCLLPALVFLGMSRHAQESRERGEERGRTHVAVSDSTVDRWEGLPGIKVQSQGNTTPRALVLGDLSM